MFPVRVSIISRQVVNLIPPLLFLIVIIMRPFYKTTLTMISTPKMTKTYSFIIGRPRRGKILMFNKRTHKDLASILR